MAVKKMIFQQTFILIPVKIEFATKTKLALSNYEVTVVFFKQTFKQPK
jgi:hypothetical protein